MEVWQLGSESPGAGICSSPKGTEGGVRHQTLAKAHCRGRGRGCSGGRLRAKQGGDG